MHSPKTSYEKEGVPDLVFAALAHSARQDMVRRTLIADHAISALARRYDMTFAGVQKHVAVLEKAGLVSKTQPGREQMVRADPETLAAAREVLEHLETFWEQRFDICTCNLGHPGLPLRQESQVRTASTSCRGEACPSEGYSWRQWGLYS